MLQFLERGGQVCDGTDPAIEAPHQHYIYLAPARGAGESVHVGVVAQHQFAADGRADILGVCRRASGSAPSV
jgi:hypothetical protein